MGVVGSRARALWPEGCCADLEHLGLLMNFQFSTRQCDMGLNQKEPNCWASPLSSL